MTPGTAQGPNVTKHLSRRRGGPTLGGPVSSKEAYLRRGRIAPDRTPHVRHVTHSHDHAPLHLLSRRPPFSHRDLSVRSSPQQHPEVPPTVDGGTRSGRERFSCPVRPGETNDRDRHPNRVRLDPYLRTTPRPTGVRPARLKSETQTPRRSSLSTSGPS